MSMTDAIAPHTIRWLHTDVSSWAITSQITRVAWGRENLTVDHTMAGRWPVTDGIEGNPWIIAQVNGQWYAATYEWLRSGQVTKGITAENIGPHTKRPPLEAWRPVPGEQVGFLVSTPARDGQRTANERSNIVKASWGDGIINSTSPPPPDVPAHGNDLAQIQSTINKLEAELQTFRQRMVSDLAGVRESIQESVLTSNETLATRLSSEMNRLAQEIVSQVKANTEAAVANIKVSVKWPWR